MTSPLALAPLNLDGYSMYARSDQYGSVQVRRIVRAMFIAAEKDGNADIANFIGKCAMCGYSMPLNALEAGHVIAATNGGLYWPSNVLPMCRPCNGELGGNDLGIEFMPHYDSRIHFDGILPTDSTNVRANPDIRKTWIRA